MGAGWKSPSTGAWRITDGTFVYPIFFHTPSNLTPRRFVQPRHKSVLQLLLPRLLLHSVYRSRFKTLGVPIGYGHLLITASISQRPEQRSADGHFPLPGANLHNQHTAYTAIRNTMVVGGKNFRLPDIIRQVRSITPIS